MHPATPTYKANFLMDFRLAGEVGTSLYEHQKKALTFLLEREREILVPMGDVPPSGRRNQTLLRDRCPGSIWSLSARLRLSPESLNVPSWPLMYVSLLGLIPQEFVDRLRFRLDGSRKDYHTCFPYRCDSQVRKGVRAETARKTASTPQDT